MQTAEARISASAFADTKPHYDILDGLRGVAALTVVCFHLFEAYATSHLDQRINHGYLAVDFFFILSSGFIGIPLGNQWIDGIKGACTDTFLFPVLSVAGSADRPDGVRLRI